MSITAVVVIVLAMSLVIGPLLMFKPSTHQRKVAQWRQIAAQKRFQVQLMSIKDRTCAVYRLPWPTKKARQFWCLEKMSYVHEIHFADYWQWLGSERADAATQIDLKALLANLPVDVVKIESSPVGFGIAWQELGGPQALEQVMGTIETFVNRH